MRRQVVWAAFVAASLVLAAPGAASSADLEANYKKAQVDGKYRMLLHQLKVETDADAYTAFKDLGFQNRRDYKDHKNLTPGHWVYVAPYWYVWRDKTAAQRPRRDWGPEQAIGEPDTQMAGDIVTAWASASQDGQKEWLALEYDEFVEPTAVLVHETYNPGAVYKVTAFKPDGEEVELWSGTDPTAADAGLGVSEIPVKTNFKTNRIKVYVDSPSVPGWNEIDAVGLRDKQKKTVWAAAVDASTTYAQPFDAVPPPLARSRTDERLEKLEKDVQDLKALIEDLKKTIMKKDK